MLFLKLLRKNSPSVSFPFQRLRKLDSLIRNYNDIPFEDIPEVSPALIKRTFKAHNVIFEEGYTCFIAHCPVCSKSTTKANPRNVYINKTTGMFMCASCKCTGQWDFIEKWFSLKKKRNKQDEIESLQNESVTLLESLNELRENTQAIKSFYKDVGFSELLKKFKLPIVPTSAVESFDIRVDKNAANLYFPLENVESEIVGYHKFNYHTSNHSTVPRINNNDNNYGGLLTGRVAKNKELAVLVPTISDFLVLVNARINAVCLPNGVNNLSQYFLPSLERFKKIVLWFGNDLKSWDSARHFAKKLGEKRCLFVRPSEKHLLPHLMEGHDFKTIVNGAQPIWHKSITTFASLRQDVLSDLQNIDKVQGVKWKRYPTLNKILKGHRRGELTVITGPTGSGKTTFISEYSLDLAMQGVNTLWGSFEIRNARLARTMLQQMAELPLDENLHLFDSWADDFEKLPVYFMTFHGQQSIKVVMEAVDHATYVHDIAHVIIDNVQFMMGVTEEAKHMDRFWKQDAIIGAFRDFATRKNCHVSLVIHPRKEREADDLTTSSIFGGAKASQEADNILIIQDKRLTSIRGKKYLQVAKNRYSGDLGVMALDFDKSSLSYSQKKKKEAKEIAKEVPPE